MFSKFIYSVGLLGTAALLSACDGNQRTGETIYRCGGMSVLASWSGNNKLTIGIFGENIPMAVTNNAESITYEGHAKNGNGVVFTVADNMASLSLDRDGKNSFDVYECQAVVPDAERDFVSFKSIGHEPEWYFTFNNMLFGFRMLGAATESIVVPAGEFQVPQMTNGKIKMTVSKDDKDIDINIQQKVCVDNMSGQYFAYTVTIKYAGMEYNGCGLSLSDPKQSLLPI